jgi:hypothetical protein
MLLRILATVAFAATLGNRMGLGLFVANVFWVR